MLGIFREFEDGRQGHRSGQGKDSLYLLDYALCGFSVPEGDGAFASRGLKGSINLGKKGRVFARELVGLLTEDGSITKDDIYLIRLHDTYSFISMNEENCAKAIAALQGRDYNGRTIQINISNKERKTQEENADQNRA